MADTLCAAAPGGQPFADGEHAPGGGADAREEVPPLISPCEIQAHPLHGAGGALVSEKASLLGEDRREIDLHPAKIDCARRPRSDC
ncbi:hypothetical protein WME79_09945 [Sorangium sp. So ce726]|uniref:hypothetical protein n=1 Tax=Sorangium sp. So ce726 TaxID=3133319 RepID=UPI003F6084FF